MEVKTLDEFETEEAKESKGAFLFVPASCPERQDYVWMLCPGCGQRSALPIRNCAAPLGWRLVSREPLTLEPSIYHNEEYCGWHGYLRNGEFVQ
jgi:hypothetical protein